MNINPKGARNIAKCYRLDQIAAQLPTLAFFERLELLHEQARLRLDVSRMWMEAVGSYGRPDVKH